MLQEPVYPTEEQLAAAGKSPSGRDRLLLAFSNSHSEFLALRKIACEAIITETNKNNQFDFAYTILGCTITALTLAYAFYIRDKSTCNRDDLTLLISPIITIIWLLFFVLRGKNRTTIKKQLFGG